MKFSDLGISDEFIKVLKYEGIIEPTDVQKRSIIPIKDGKDVICEAQTGTGKTYSFLLPVFENINPSLNYVQGLIITPTRELALQITAEAEKLKKAKDINVLCIYGGKDIGSQMKKLNKNIHLIIATPGRLIDHIERKTVELKNLKTLILDEADQLLLMGFKNDIEKIIKELPKKRQTLCFSATMTSDVNKLAYKYMKDPQVISIKKQEVTLENITEQVVLTTDRNKRDDLCKVLQEDNPFMAIIFCRTKRRADELEVVLYQRGYNCVVIHSDIPESKRERIMKSFRNADIQYLIATDVASRGLDISGVSHVYNYDMPETVEGYIHRIGRTGRANEKGYTCLFAAEKDMNKLSEIEKALKSNISRRKV